MSATLIDSRSARRSQSRCSPVVCNSTSIRRIRSGLRLNRMANRSVLNCENSRVGGRCRVHVTVRALSRKPCRRCRRRGFRRGTAGTRRTGLHVRLRSSKTDQEAHGQVKAVAVGPADDRTGGSSCVAMSRTAFHSPLSLGDRDQRPETGTVARRGQAARPRRVGTHVAPLGPRESPGLGRLDCPGRRPGLGKANA